MRGFKRGIYMSGKRSLLNLLFWIALAILFNLYVFYSRGERAGVEFFAGYVIEMSLSLDNLFLFLMIFTNFGIRKEYQSKVLLFGVIGAMILRLFFILLGASVINKFQWILYIFGLFLIYSGINMIFKKEGAVDYSNSIVIKILKKIMPVSNELKGNKFFFKRNNILYATPLFAILLVIEFSDLIFALDSIPAIFSITRDIFVVYTSNIFAILGLRSMYYILVKMNDMFKFMKIGVALILIFTGIKLGIAYFNIEISASISVLIILTIIFGSILLSLLFEEIFCKRKKFPYGKR